MVMSPQVSWLFFKARAKRPYLIHTGRASNAEKQPTGRGPEGCVENGPAAALLVGYVPHHFCTAGRKPYRSVKWCGMLPLLPVRLLAPCRRPILNATTSSLYARRYTREGRQGTDALRHLHFGICWLRHLVQYLVRVWAFDACAVVGRDSEVVGRSARQILDSICGYILNIGDLCICSTRNSYIQVVADSVGCSIAGRRVCIPS